MNSKSRTQRHHKQGIVLDLLAGILLAILTLSILGSRVVLNEQRIITAFNQTQLSVNAAHQANQKIQDELKIPLNNVKLITPAMVKTDFKEVIENGFQHSELNLANSTVNQQIKQALVNNGINAPLINTIVDQVSPNITNQINRKINTKANRQLLNTSLVVRKISDGVSIISILLLVLLVIIAFWHRRLLKMLGNGGIVAGVMLGLTILFQSYLFKHIVINPLIIQIKQRVVTDLFWIAMALLLMGIVSKVCQRLKK